MQLKERSGSEWELRWNHDETMVIFNEVENGQIIKEFALAAPSYARLYYSLMDWFSDDPASYPAANTK